jgi:hypothetical protein
MKIRVAVIAASLPFYSGTFARHGGHAGHGSGAAAVAAELAKADKARAELRGY